MTTATRRRAWSGALGAVALLLLLLAPAGRAAWPGDHDGVIAYQSDETGDWEIWIVDADGAERTNLTNNPALDEQPAWSPDGSKLAFVSDRNGMLEIFTMNADGTDQMGTGQEGDEPSWTTDGRIAFDCLDDQGFTPRVCVMDADGANLSFLTPDSWWSVSPKVSPDGTKIAYTHGTLLPSDIDFDVYVMDIDGQNPAPVASGAKGQFVRGWSPDGGEILYNNEVNGIFELWVIGADGSNPTQLVSRTSNPPERLGADFSPTGSRIVTQQPVGAAESDLWLFDADGSNGTRLLERPGIQAAPVWRPAFEPPPTHTCGGLVATIVGGPGDDTLTGTDQADVIVGLGGNDILEGLAGDDRLCGNDGDDILRGGPGNDEMYGAAGNDLIRGLTGNDVSYGGPGDDRIQDGPGIDRLYGGDGKDKMWGGNDDDELYGDYGNDQLRGGRDNDVLRGGDGTDRIWGESGRDTLYGDSRSDFLYGGVGRDTMWGGDGNDRLFGWTDDDILYGEDGRDQLRGQAGDDVVDGGPRYDFCSAETVWINCEKEI